MAHPPLKAVFFDLMGTLLDWHSSILPYLPHSYTTNTKEISDFALEWRQGFFDEIQMRFKAGQTQEDIDVTHARVLERLLELRNWDWNETEKNKAVESWHNMKPWSEVPATLKRLKETFVLANGTTRLQLDLMASSGLQFDMLFSSQLLGLTKPDPAIYLKAMSLIQVEPSECFMVAAHAYDLRAAKAVGMRTAYITRWTEDLKENMQTVKEENELFFEGTDDTDSQKKGGFVKLAETLLKGSI